MGRSYSKNEGPNPAEWQPRRGKRSRGQPSRIWQDDITEREGTSCIRKATDRRQWRTLIDGGIHPAADGQNLDKDQEVMPLPRGRTYAKKLRFLRKKRAGYANMKMLCVYCTQKTVTSYIKMRLVFSFFAPSREGLYSTCCGSKHLKISPAPSLPHRIPVKECWCLRYDVHDTHRQWSRTHAMRATD